MKTNELSLQVTGDTAKLNDGASVFTPGNAGQAVGTEEVAASGLPVTFKVKRSTGFAKSEDWNVTLSETTAVFTQVEAGERIEVAREKATVEMTFSQEFSLFASKTLNIFQDGKTYTFQVDSSARSMVLSWLPKASAVELKGELRKWGVGLIILGILHFLLQGILEPTWGVVICIVGTLNLLISHKAMFIVNGICLILVGLMNMAAGGGWKFFGVMQIIWGVQEMRKMGRFE